MDHTKTLCEENASQDSAEARIRRLVALDPRALSTGAYGDEGEVLMQIESHLLMILGKGHAEAILEWMKAPVGRVSREFVHAVVGFAKEFVGEWTPLRWRASQREIDAVLMDVMGVFRAKRLAPGWTPEGEGALVLDLERRVLKAVHSRLTFSVTRGGGEWQVLHGADLLPLLGPFLREA
jgi:hypothetical protein